MAPPEEYAKYSAILSSVFALSTLLGPLFGGLINNSQNSTWRWIFLLKYIIHHQYLARSIETDSFHSVPGGVIVIGLILIAIPWSFPLPAGQGPSLAEMLSRKRLRRIDYTGFFLLMAACMLLITSLEEGGTEYSWTSATVLATLIVSIVLFVLFLLWQRYQFRRTTKQEAVLPWNIVTDRVTLGTLLYELNPPPQVITK